MGYFQLRVQGYGWSTSFSVCSEGAVRVPIGREDGTDQLLLRVQVRSGTKNSRYEVIFRPNSVSGPYRYIKDASTFLPDDLLLYCLLGSRWYIFYQLPCFAYLIKRCCQICSSKANISLVDKVICGACMILF